MVLLRHDVEFDETKGSQVENENLEDIRGIQLSNAMKNMDVGELTFSGILLASPPKAIRVVGGSPTL